MFESCLQGFFGFWLDPLGAAPLPQAMLTLGCLHHVLILEAPEICSLSLVLLTVWDVFPWLEHLVLGEKIVDFVEVLCMAFSCSSSASVYGMRLGPFLMSFISVRGKELLHICF